ncbi:MAG: hypothetical protein OHK0053_19860 [Microscillaceae bacterium]
MSELNLSNAAFFVHRPTEEESAPNMLSEKTPEPMSSLLSDKAKLAEALFQQRKTLNLMVQGSFLMMHFAVLIQALQKKGE